MGNLTLLGTTKPITFDVSYSGQSAGLNARAGLTARATIGQRLRFLLLHDTINQESISLASAHLREIEEESYPPEQKREQ